MIHRRVLVPVVAASLFFAACSKEPPPPPAPTGPTQAQLDSILADSIARAQADSVARANAAAAEEARAREAAVRAARATLEERVHFDYDESAIRPDAERVLRQKVDILRNSPAVQVRVEGHADERGSTEYNLALGNRRAESVRQFFTGFGLDAGRFAIVSFGEERPLAQGSDEGAWGQNRRAEFVITAGADQIIPPQP